MAFIEYNPNPVGRRVGDCAVRAVAKALKLDWETAYVLLTINGFSMGDMPSADSVWDSEADIIYIKSVDTSGMPSLKILDYTVRNNTPQKAEISPQTDFVTKDELLTIKEEISALKAKFERIDNTVDNRKEHTDVK